MNEKAGLIKSNINSGFTDVRSVYSGGKASTSFSQVVSLEEVRLR